MTYLCIDKKNSCNDVYIQLVEISKAEMKYLTLFKERDRKHNIACNHYQASFGTRGLECKISGSLASHSTIGIINNFLENFNNF